jgi:hypothetical protein
LDPDGSKQWYNRYGGLRGSEQPVPGKCGGRLWRTNPPRYCRRNPVKGKDKCRLHGGNAPIGIANGAYRDGRFSKHLPAGDLRNKYKRIVTNPDVISLRDDVALIQTRQALLLERLGDVSSPAWDEALAAYNASEKAKGRDRAAAMSRLGEVLRKGADADQVERQVWSELRKLIQEKTRTTAAEWKRVLDLSGVMTAQDALYFVESVLNTLRECIPDRQTLQRVQTRLLEYMPKEGK